MIKSELEQLSWLSKIFLLVMIIKKEEVPYLIITLRLFLTKLP
jgi:hypothetical protein